MRIIRIAVLTIMPAIGGFMLFFNNLLGFSVLIAWFMFIGFLVGLMVENN